MTVLPPGQQRRTVLFALLICLAILAPIQILATGGSSSDPAASATPSTEPTPPRATDASSTAPPGEPDASPGSTTDPLPSTTPAPTAGETPSDEPTDGPPSSAPTGEPSTQPTDDPSAQPSESPAPVDAEEWLITFGDRTAFEARAALFAGAGVTETSSIDALLMATIDLPVAGSGTTVAALQAQPGVAHLEPDRERSIEAEPNDPLYAQQWALPKIGWPSVHDAGVAGHAIVALLDSGVNATHVDLSDNLLPGVSFVEGVAPDTDLNGHGTWMAGIVAAMDDNAEGVAGAGSGALKVLPLTVISADGTGTDGDIISGLVYAVDHDADVVLMAFSSRGYSAALQTAIDYAWSHDVVVVAATGNDASSAASYPAGDAGVVGVSATTSDDAPWSQSNTGADVFLAAPGTDIVTTSADGQYATISGTSASAAYVAAAAGLLRANDATLTNGAIIGRLARSSAAVGDKSTTGNGRLDLGRAWTDASVDEVKPAGAHNATGGPFVGPYGGQTDPQPSPSPSPSGSPPTDGLPPPDGGAPGDGGAGSPPVYTVSAWYGVSGWTERKQITLLSSQIPSTQTNFPVLISLSSDADLAADAQSSGNDILFTSADGTTKLSHQIETYTSGTGALVAWVRIPSLSGSVDTVIYMYYGNPSASNQQDTTGGTWETNYAGVWHLSNGTTLSVADTSGNSRNGTNTGTQATTGKIDGGANFSAGNFYVTLPSSSLPAANNFTVSLWFKLSSAAAKGALFAEQNAAIGTTPSSWDPMLYVDSTGKLAGGIYTGAATPITSASAVNNNVWHYAVLTVNTTSALQTLYLDGSQVGTWSGTPEGPFTTVAIGAGYTNSWPNPPSSGTSYFGGQIDEVRASSSATVRTANWITTEWNNQNNPGSFYTVGSAQANDPNPPTVSITSPSGGANVTNGVAITTTASDVGSGVAQVELRYCSGWSCSFSSGTSIGTDTGTPYNFTWSGQPSNGTYTLVARATDVFGNTTDSTTVTVVVANSGLSLALDSTASNAGSAVTTLSWSHTIGSGSNRILVVGIETESTSTSSSCQITSGYPRFNGTSMTKIASTVTTLASTYECVAMYYMLAPATGTFTIQVNFNAAVAVTGGSISGYNVKQSAPDASTTSFNNSGMSSGTLTTLAANSGVIDVYGTGNSLGDLAPSASGQVGLVLANNAATGSDALGMSSKSVASAGSTTMSWTHTGENRSAIVAAAFAPFTDTTAPTSTLSFTEGTSPGTQYQVSTGAHAWSYYYSAATTTTFTMTDTASDAGTGINEVEFPGISVTGFNGTGVADTSSPYTSNTYTITTSNLSAPPAQTVNVFDNAGNLTQETVTFIRDTTAPSGQSVSLSGGPTYTSLSVPLTINWGSDSGAGLDATTQVVQRASATMAGGVCGTFGGFTTNVTLVSGADTSVAWNNCYRYRLQVQDNVDNLATSAQSADALVTETNAPSISISTPTAGASITNGQSLTASASDAESGVSSVAYRYCAGWSCAYASGTTIGSSASSPYSVTWSSQPANGTYTIVARATDVAGNTADATVTVVVANSTSGVNYDATSSTKAAATTSLTWSHTVGTRANRVLIVGVTSEYTSTACQPSAVSYNGSAMTLINQTVVTGGFEECASLWYQLNPATGAHNVSVTFANAVDATGGAVSLFNVKQAAPDASNTGINTAGISSTAVTTLAANSWVIDVYASGNALGDLGAAGSQNQLWALDVGGAATASGGMSYVLKATAGSQTMTWTHTGENRSAQVVTAFAPIVDTTAPTSSLSFTEGTSPGTQYQVSTGAHAWTYYYSASTTTTFTMTDTASDAGSGINAVEFPDLSLTGFTGTGFSDTSSPYTSNTYTITTSNASAPTVQKVNVFDNLGNLTQETVTFVRDVSGPSATSTLTAGPYYSTLSVALTLSSSDSESGVATTQVQRDTATLTNGSCGTFSGSWSNVTLSGGADTGVTSGNCYRYRYVVTDNVGNVTNSTQTADAKIDTSAPGAPSLSYSAMTNMFASGNSLYYRPGAAGGLTVTASATDAQSGIASYTFPTLPAGWTISGSGASRSWTYTTNPTAPSGNQNVSATNNSGLTSTNTAFTVTADSSVPTGQTVTVTGGFYTTASVALTLANGSDTGSGINAASGVVKRASATLSGGVCQTFGGFTTTVTLVSGADTSVVTGNCYRYQYFISDNVGNQSAASASSADAKIDVNAPTVVNDSYSVNEDATLNVSAPGVLTNDSDTENGALSASVVTNVTHGALTLNTNGSFTYTPTGDYSGTDSFTYRVNDGAWNSASATVTITINAVNDPPINGVPGAQATAVNTSMVFSSAGGNAISISDVDAGTSNMQIQLSVTNGTLTLGGISGLSFTVGDGTTDAAMTFTGQISAINTALNGLTFNPTNQVAGTATLQIVTSDQGATGSGGTLTDTDTVSISIINATPVANNDSYSTTQNNPIIVAASGVLANDTDANSATQTLTVQTPRPVSGPSHGTLTLNADGSFTYTPTNGYSGTDSFTYKATDGIADSAAATVTITITTNAYVSSSGWSSSFSASRYLDWTFPGYVPAGSVVEGGTFRHTYRSYNGGTTCYYFEVWSGGVLIGTHGSSGSPVSCATTSFVTDTVSLPEINTAARANSVTIRLFVRNSAGGQSEHAKGNLGVTYYLGNP